MPARYSVKIYDPIAGETYHIRAGAREYVLQQAEAQGVNLPFSCRNGACTSCAVRVLSGDLEQPAAMGLSAQLKALGYALLCVSYPRSDLKVELQAEDEVYLLQFGQQFAQGEVRAGLPLEGD